MFSKYLFALLGSAIFPCTNQNKTKSCESVISAVGSVWEEFLGRFQASLAERHTIPGQSHLFTLGVTLSNPPIDVHALMFTIPR